MKTFVSTGLQTLQNIFDSSSGDLLDSGGRRFGSSWPSRRTSGWSPDRSPRWTTGWSSGGSTGWTPRGSPGRPTRRTFRRPSGRNRRHRRAATRAAWTWDRCRTPRRVQDTWSLMWIIYIYRVAIKLSKNISEVFFSQNMIVLTHLRQDLLRCSHQSSYLLSCNLVCLFNLEPRAQRQSLTVPGIIY